MHDSAVQVDLIWLLGLDEEFLGSMAFLGGEDVVGFGCGNREWTGDCEELVFFDETEGMVSPRALEG